MTVGSRVRRVEAPSLVGTITVLYEGMKTKTKYAVVDWDGDGEHVARQDELEVIDEQRTAT